MVREFIFRATFSRIKQSTLFLPKIFGGINLHNLELKHTSFRLKYIQKGVNNPNKHVFFYYYFSMQCKQFIPFDNKRPHHSLELPPFYVSLKNVLGKHGKHINKTAPNMYYKTLQQEQKSPIEMEIKRLTTDTLASDIFPEIHSTFKTTPFEKQITYRLLFGITPTTEYLSKKHNFRFSCKICHSLNETEEHLFYLCPVIKKLKLQLIRLLRQPYNTYFDTTQSIYKAIFLNIYPKESLPINNYRYTIYTILAT